MYCLKITPMRQAIKLNITGGAAKIKKRKMHLLNFAEDIK